MKSRFLHGGGLPSFRRAGVVSCPDEPNANSDRKGKSGKLSGLRLYEVQPTAEPLPGDYGLMEMPGAPAHLEAIVLGWRFSHAVVYIGHGQLAEAWFDCVRKRSVAEYPARDISWFGVRRAPDGSRVMQSQRDRVSGYAVSRLGQLYDYPAWPAVYIRYIGRIDLSAFYAVDPLATCSGLVAKAYHLAGLDLIDKPVLNLVTPDDLDPGPGNIQNSAGARAGAAESLLPAQFPSLPSALCDQRARYIDLPIGPGQDY